MFFYECNINKRQEEISPFAKPSKRTNFEKKFDKQSSVFAKWRKDNNEILKTAFEEDMRLWKGYRFIKDELERQETQEILKKNFKILKEIFIYQISMSSYPSIS